MTDPSTATLVTNALLTGYVFGAGIGLLAGARSAHMLHGDPYPSFLSYMSWAFAPVILGALVVLCLLP